MLLKRTLFRASKQSFFLTLLLFSTSLSHAQVHDIPALLKTITETKRDDERLEAVKKIHDIIVNANYKKRGVVKRIEKYIPAIEKAILDGYDKPNLTMKHTWLNSAVNFFNQEKKYPVVDIPKNTWRPVQHTADDGAKIEVFPNKIIHLKNNRYITAVESSSIHEAAISPDGQVLAYFRGLGGGIPDEIWVHHLETEEHKQVAKVSDCKTLLFSKDSNWLFFQEKTRDGQESWIYKVPVRGGEKERFAKARLLETVVNKGKYKGAVIVYKNSAHPLGVAKYECPFAFKPSGKMLGKLRFGPCR